MPLIIPKAAGNGGCTPSLKSRVLNTVWSWNFHQRCPLRNYDNWSYHRPARVTGVNLQTRNRFLMTSAKMKIDVITQLLLSRGTISKSRNIIACLGRRNRVVIIFIHKNWSVNSVHTHINSYHAGIEAMCGWLLISKCV